MWQLTQKLMMDACQLCCWVYIIKPSEVGDIIQDFQYHWGDGGKQPKICSFLPPGKKNPPSHMEKSQTHPLSCPTQHQIFISPVSKPKPLNCWYRHIEKQHWEPSLWIGIGGLEQGPKSGKSTNQMILPILANSPSKLAEKKYSFEPQQLLFFFSIRVFFQGH